MEYGAIDLHTKECQIRIVAEDGQVLVDRRITTARDRLTAVFGSRPPLRILIEASAESEWVAQHLERLGHAVVVADPNYTPMYGARTRRIKTDRRDVAALVEACRLGIYHPAHRRSVPQRLVQDDLNVRSELVQARVRAMALARTITRAAGFRLRSGASESFLTRLAALDLPVPMADTLAPLHQVIDVLDHALAAADARFATRVATDPVIQRLMTVPGIGPITASAFVAALDDVHRFAGPRGAARVASLGDRTVYIPHAIDTAQFAFTPRTRASTFVHCRGWGGVQQRKGTDLVLAAARRCPKVPFTIRHQHWDDTPVSPNVTLIGASSEPRELYGTGDVAIQPSRWEGVGLQILEAMSCGLPTIVADGPPMNEYPSTRALCVAATARPIDLGHKPWLAWDMSVDALVDTIQAMHGQPLGELSAAARARMEARSWAQLRPRYASILGMHCAGQEKSS